MAYLFKTITSSAPVQVTGDNTFCSYATFFAYSGFIGGVPQPNVGTLYLCTESTRFPVVISKSGNYVFNAPKYQNTKDLLQNFWVSGTAGDGVYVWFY